MRHIVIEVSGGVVQEVYGDTDDVQVTLLDWDAGESPGDAFTGGPFPLQPLTAMRDDTAQAFAVLARDDSEGNDMKNWQDSTDPSIFPR